MNKTVPNIAHPHPFDPTYGYDLEQLLAVGVPDEPPDFAAFWEQTYALSRSLPLRIEKRKVPCARGDFVLYEVEFDSLGGVRIGGWITLPKSTGDAAPRGGWVVGHGYGGRDEPSFDLPSPAGAAIFFCARGFNRSAHPALPSEAPRHVVHGIENRESYAHRGCVADLWAAATALIELFPGAAENLRYCGTSFGGGIGALALPWDARFHRAYLDIPSFGQHPLRVQMPCVGSGEAVRQRYLRHPEVLDVLAYFDAATAASHIKIPTFVSPALFDPAVPPPGQFAVYNAIPAPKDLYVRTTGHYPSPMEDEEQRELNLRLARWFAE